MFEPDQKIRETNTDAAVSKLSCVKAGYFEDEFLHLFVPSYAAIRRNPIINKGYYVRVMLFRRLVDQFVKTYNDGCQILFLGAGTDTNGLRVIRQYSDTPVSVFEVDFPELVQTKLRIIKKNRLEFSFLGDIESTTTHSDVSNFGTRFRLVAHDLRDPIADLMAKLDLAGFNRDVPTLFASECMLIYLDMEEANRIIASIAKIILNDNTIRVLAIYEQINTRDPFGRMMVENLNSRGCSLRSIVDSPAEMTIRLTSLGFEGCRTELMTHFDPLVPVKRPEIIDELEEYNLLQSHYAFTLAWSGNESAKNYVDTVMDSDGNIS